MIVSVEKETDSWGSAWSLMKLESSDSLIRLFLQHQPSPLSSIFCLSSIFPSSLLTQTVYISSCLYLSLLHQPASSLFPDVFCPLSSQLSQNFHHLICQNLQLSHLLSIFRLHLLFLLPSCITKKISTVFERQQTTCR